MNYKVISFYRYTKLDKPQELQNQLQIYCQENNILGRILLGKEGINGAVSARVGAIEQFKQELNEIFPNLTFREQLYLKQTYHKLVVRARDEICAFGEDVNLKNKGEYLEPKQLKQWYDNNEDFVIVDARNNYEYDLGRFKNAVKLPIKNFREFPTEIQKHQEWKDKKVVLYCTGGIRCEKASAYMKEQGFNSVHHVKGGIINYVNQFPDTNWEGGLFVFDDRLVSDVGEAVTSCANCGKKEQQYYNCHNLDCDRLFICCLSCADKMNQTCSLSCKEAPRQRKGKERVKQVLGRVKNYYPKVGVALIKVDGPIERGNSISIEGKTTSFAQEIIEMCDDDGNQIERAGANEYVTIPVKEKVRKNDKVRGVAVSI